MPGDNSARLPRDRPKTCFIAFVNPAEMAECNHLSFHAYNRANNLVLLEVALSGAARGKNGEDLILFSGGREGLAPGKERVVRFPAESFGFYGRERGWENVSRIEVVGKREKTDMGKEPIDVVISDLCGECRDVPPGPRLTEEGLALRIHADFPDPLSSKGSTNSSEGPALRPHPYPEERADEILAGAIMGQKLPDPIPWDFSPDGAHEWTHFLNRHHFLRPVLRAFLATKEHKYLKCMEDTISYWIRKHPVPLGSNGGAGPAWETLSAAWRLREWLEINKALWSSPSCRPETRNLLLRSCWEHCRHLMDHRGHPNNWTIMEAGALTLAGIEMTFFTDAASWRREGIARLTREIGRQFMADGGHYECSPLYHALCLELLLEVRQTAGKYGIKLPAEFHAPLEKAADYLGALCRPDFTWPSLNDSGSATGDYTTVMELAGKAFGREDFTWLGTRGERGEPPPQKTCLFRSTGIAVMRSGWEKASHSLLFRAGPPGMSHVHEDVLSLDISVAGVPCLVDPGITAYAPGPRSLWYRSAAAHNMILIDGEGPVRSGLPYQKRIQPAGKSLFLSAADGRPHIGGVCREYRGVDKGAAISVTRKAALLDDCWIITDLIAGAGDCRVTVCWQFFPGRVRYDAKTYTAFYTDVGGRGCTLALSSDGNRPDVVHFRGRLRPCAGWVSIEGQDIPADNFQFSFPVTLPLALSWEIRPYAGRGQASP